MNNNKLVMGILAHVDAGKTTLSEAILYQTESIRNLGRVDHKNTFLDTDDLERLRGITIFSKQACFHLQGKEITLLDTPGHVDFSAEMERTLQVLDYAVLVVSGADGVQGHTLTAWKLLKKYGLPTFLFINKMDQKGRDKALLLNELQARLDDRCIDFSRDQDRKGFLENLAMCDEVVMEHYLETGTVLKEQIGELILKRRVFPCYFGSALKMEGVEDLLEGFGAYTFCPCYPEEFGGKVFKITRDKQGTRLTHMKITGGTLKVKDFLGSASGFRNEGQQQEGQGKVDQIRYYSGERYEIIGEAVPGMICAVTGPRHTYSGQGLGREKDSGGPVLKPVLTYCLNLPSGCDVHGMLLKLKELEEEKPELHIVWEEQKGEIHLQVMGQVETEILASMVWERYGIPVTFDSGSLLYKETILKPVEGVGHFEPLRHYAEVHLLLKPGEPGSGLVFSSDLSEDDLSRNWQRLVLTHLEEKLHKGVLTGSEITDMKITLVAGRAHQKHTEGGDFRQATYRALRQGLRRAESVLLEPVYEFRLEIPSEMTGRALADIQRMHGFTDLPEIKGEYTVLKGTGPVSTMREYQMDVAAYTKGLGRLFCSLKGYEPCHNQEEVIDRISYDPDSDMENPCGSVFCAHGAGFNVSWDKVEEYMHVESVFKLTLSPKLSPHNQEPRRGKESVLESKAFYKGEKELEEIFLRTYGPSKRDKGPASEKRVFRSGEKFRNLPQGKADKPSKNKQQPSGNPYLLVDGYNIIFAWEDLSELSKVSMEAARRKLMDILSNYQGYRRDTVILVFDAYKVEGNPGSVEKYHNIHVVYTREAETADQYIEKTVHEMGKKYDVTVATSDALQQMIVWGDGARRLSAQGLREEIRSVNREIQEEFLNTQNQGKHYPFQDLLH